MEIHVKSQNNNEGISQAIMRKLVEAGGDRSKINKNRSLWNQIIEEFKNDADSTVESSDGKNKKTLSEAFKENMTVFSNYVIKITDATWNKMLDMVKGLGNFKEGQTAVDNTEEGDETIEQQVKITEGKYTTSSIKVNAPKQKYASQDSDVREIYSAREQAKVQETFDDANQLLVDVANKKYEVEIIQGYNVKGNYNWKRADLPDGRCIKVSYDDKGEISEIKISYDTAPDQDEDGNEFDGAEVKYTDSKAKVSTSHESGIYDHSITSGYDFEKLKAVAEAIFGKWEEE